MVARRTIATFETSMTSPNTILEITDRSFAETVMQSKVPVLLAFCADGCSASQRLQTLLTNATRSHSSAMIAKATPTESPEMLARFGIISLPAVLLFNGETVCYQFMGELSQRELHELLARADGKNFINQDHPAMAQP